MQQLGQGQIQTDTLRDVLTVLHLAKNILKYPTYISIDIDCVDPVYDVSEITSLLTATSIREFLHAII